MNRVARPSYDDLVGRRIERLTLDHLEQLPGGCGECVFWQLDPVRRDAVRGKEAEEKAAWVSNLLLEWGSCGRVAVVDGEVVGHIIWAPPAHVPTADEVRPQVEKDEKDRTHRRTRAAQVEGHRRKLHELIDALPARAPASRRLTLALPAVR